MKRVAVLRGADQVAPLFYGIGDKGKIIGGFVRWMVSPLQSPAPPGDIDIYPNTEEAHQEIDYWICRNIPLEKTAKGKWMHKTNISTTYTQKEGRKIQVINPLNQGKIVALGTMEEVIGNFDFTVTRAGLVSLAEAVVDDDFIRDEMRQHLVIKTIHCPIGSVKRVAKYAKKGYYISPVEIAKLFNEWDARTDAYKEELKEALEAYDMLQAVHNQDDDSDLQVVDSSAVQKLADLIYVD